MFKTTLKEMLESEENTVKKVVIEDILDRADIDDDDGMKNYVHDITHYGCSGGSVSGLVYYVDTHAFFDEHTDSIADYIDEYQDETGEGLRIDGDLKNFYAWFAYEWAMNDIYHQLASEELIEF